MIQNTNACVMRGAETNMDLDVGQDNVEEGPADCSLMTKPSKNLSVFFSGRLPSALLLFIH